MSMDDDTVTRIAAEPEENQAMREQLSRKLTVLKAGLDICNRYTRRQATPHIAVSKLPVENPWKREKGTMSPPPSDIDGVDSDSKVTNSQRYFYALADITCSTALTLVRR